MINGQAGEIRIPKPEFRRNDEIRSPKLRQSCVPFVVSLNSLDLRLKISGTGFRGNASRRVFAESQSA